jgi:gas vesicle protein
MVQGTALHKRRTKMSDNESGGGFGWFLAGLGVGALVGVLYAPKSGKETREDIVAGAREARERANELYVQGVDQVGQYVEKGRQVAGQYVDQTKQTANEYVDKGKQYYDKSRQQWTEYVEKGKDLIQTQTEAAKAAVEAGKDAYAAKTTTTTTT